MNKFKVGDRIKIYDCEERTGTIIKINNNFCHVNIKSKTDDLFNNEYEWVYHYKQCRKLVKKFKPKFKVGEKKVEFKIGDRVNAYYPNNYLCGVDYKFNLNNMCCDINVSIRFDDGQESQWKEMYLKKLKKKLKIKEINWIPCKNKLPECSGKYLYVDTYKTGSTCEIVMFHKENNTFEKYIERIIPKENIHERERILITLSFNSYWAFLPHPTRGS